MLVYYLHQAGCRVQGLGFSCLLCTACVGERQAVQFVLRAAGVEMVKAAEDTDASLQLKAFLQ